MEKQIIVVCGLPLSGKSTVARELKRALKVPWVDVDTVRQKLFHHPQAEMEQNKDRFQMNISYSYLFLIGYRLLERCLSVIFSATFSREECHDALILLSEVIGVPVKVVYCWAPDRVIQGRIIEREERQDSFSTCRTFGHYVSSKARYKLLPLPRIDVDTSQPLEGNIEKIMAFVKS